MCSNYVPTAAELLKGIFPLSAIRERAEAYPGYEAPFIRGGEQAFLRGDRELVYGRFGLIPHWCKPGDVTATHRRTYNARSETVATKPSFRDAWAKGQFCAIPTEAIYEPRYNDLGKAERWRIERADRAPMYLAGIWSRWHHGPDGPVESFAMLTINADDHPLMRLFHAPGDEKRMVVILEEEQVRPWLQATPADAMSYMRQFPAEKLTARQELRPPREPKPRAPKSKLTDELF